MIKRGITFILWIHCSLILLGQGKIETVKITGNERISCETILYYFKLSAGYSYDEEDIERGVEALWASGFFSNIEVAVKRGEEGQVVLLSVDEYPVVEEVVFDTEGEIAEKEILRTLKNKKISLPENDVYDPQSIFEIKTTIKEMLADKGFNQGTVTSEIKEFGQQQAEVIIHIREGPKYRIGEIVFAGRLGLERSTLLNAFEYNQEHSLLSWIKGKDIFREARLDEDLDSLLRTLREHGYAEARIGDPRIEELTKRSVFGGPQRMKRIVVPVDAGHIYGLGHIQIQNSDPIPASQIRHLIDLKEGDVYNGDRINRLAEEIRILYQNDGYLHARVLSVENLDPERRKVDVTFDIHKWDKVFLRRLEITGNTMTDDRIIRGAMFVPEQETFRLDFFSESLEKLTRLGIVRIEEQPEIDPDAKDPTQMNIRLKVVETLRNEWQLTGGYSGYQSGYLGGSVSAVDLLGLGEKFDLKLEYGGRSKIYEVGIYKPYLFDRLLSIHLMLFYQNILYPDLFTRKGKGIRTGINTQVKGYWWGSLDYRFENVDSSPSVSEDSDNSERQNLGAVTLFVYRDTADDPIFPTEGSRCLLSFEYAASGLGSDIQYIKPEIEGAFFVPALWDHVLGFHLAYRSIRAIKNSEIPYWERFYMGGERSIRGYDVYSIGPRDRDGLNIGGEKSVVLNAEYTIPVFGQLAVVLFIDGGNAVRGSRAIALDDLYWSSGLEIRMKIYRFQIPLRLIFAYNNRLIGDDDSHYAFRIAFSASF